MEKTLGRRAEGMTDRSVWTKVEKNACTNLAVTDKMITPVIAGLATGIAFVIMFSILTTSFQEQTRTRNSSVTGMPEPSAMVIIPEGSHYIDSKRNNFEPEVITVVIGVNNTVTWVNEDLASASIRAGDITDRDFYNAAENSDLLGPMETFNFTFTKPGNFTYYSIPGPHRQGTVIVLPPTYDIISTSVGLSQYEAIQIVERDFKSKQRDYDRINGIVVNSTSGYVRIEDFWFKNLELPLVYVHPNGTLSHITDKGYENMGECNSGLIAYCGYLPPYNFDYKGRLVYGVEVLLFNEGNLPDVDYARGVPFLYIVDANTGEIVDSTFLREEHPRS